MKLTLTIQSPHTTGYDGPADLVHLATDLGEMEVLPGHASTLGTILTSKVRVQNDDTIDEFVVRRGTLVVDPDGVTVKILASDVDRVAEMDVGGLTSYREFLMKTLEGDDLNDYQIRFLKDEQLAIEKLMEEQK